MQLALLLASADDGGGSILVSLIPFIIIGFIMYLLLIRPQRRRMREQADLQSAVGVGDEVITTSGVYGFITGEDEENGLFWLEIDDDVQIRIAKAAVQRRISGDADDDADDADEGADEGDDEIGRPEGFPDGSNAES
jgi:preprotein translocase subunit YajC